MRGKSGSGAEQALRRIIGKLSLLFRPDATICAQRSYLIERARHLHEQICSAPETSS